MRGVAPQIPRDRKRHAPARRYEGRRASLISPRAGAAWLPTRRRKWSLCGNSASTSGKGGIRPGFHILYKTAIRQWPHWLFSRSVVSDSLRPHRLQHTRLSCPSLTPGAKLKLMSIVSGDAIQHFHSLSFPFPSYLQSFPASGSFPVSRLFTSGGQSIGVSASAPVFPMNIQG